MAFTKNDKVFQELRRKVGELANAKVRVGILSDEEVETEHGELTIVELAAIHEFGAPNAGIPERSFIRKTFEDEGRADLVDFQAEQARKVVDGKLGAKTALKQIGAWAVGRVKARIRAKIDPPNKPATIKRKGSSTPLVDTGHLANSVAWEIEESKGAG